MGCDSGKGVALLQAILGPLASVRPPRRHKGRCDGGSPVRRHRVAGVLGEDRWFLAARRSLSLGHQALRHLGLPVPDRPVGIADVLRRAGIVRARDAAGVADAYGLWRRERCWRPRFPLEASIERAWDFAWSVQVALERSCLEGSLSTASDPLCPNAGRCR